MDGDQQGILGALLGPVATKRKIHSRSLPWWLDMSIFDNEKADQFIMGHNFVGIWDGICTREEKMGKEREEEKRCGLYTRGFMLVKTSHLVFLGFHTPK